MDSTGVLSTLDEVLRLLDEDAAHEWVLAHAREGRANMRFAVPSGPEEDVTLLIFAAGLMWRPRVSTVEALLAAGCDPSARASYGLTPLHVSVSTFEPGITEALVAAGAHCNAQYDGVTPAISIAFNSPGMEAVSLLHLAVLLQVPDLDLCVQLRGKTAEEWATSKNNHKVASAIAEEVWFSRPRPPDSLIACSKIKELLPRQG
jgi:ankyrin repeat protein